MGLPWCRMVLADPGLGKPEFVGAAQRLQIPAVALKQASLRRVRGHSEEAVLHRRSPGCRCVEVILRDAGQLRTRSLATGGGPADVSICKQTRGAAAFFLP